MRWPPIRRSPSSRSTPSLSRREERSHSTSAWRSIPTPPNEVNVDLRLTPELIEIRERSRRFCDDWLVPFESETEKAGSLSLESYGRIRGAVLEARLNAMNMPTEWGGQGFSVLQQVVALEQLGRVTNALWACVWRPAQVLEHCTPAQPARLLPPPRRGAGGAPPPAHHPQPGRGR